MMRLTLALSALGLATVANAWTDSTCKKFSEIYTGGEDLITRMWGDSFKYERDESKAYTMWWTEGGAAGVADAHDNPNDLVTAAIIGSVDNKAGFNVSDQTCEVAYYHKVGPPTPETEDFTECHPWHANACCHQATVVTPEAINKAYGAGYEWDRCGPMSQACERFFVEEACMYECDANMGAFRKYTDEEKALCTADGVAAGATVTKADGSTYTCVEQSDANAENAWEIHQVRLALTGNPHPHPHPHLALTLTLTRCRSRRPTPTPSTARARMTTSANPATFLRAMPSTTRTWRSSRPRTRACRLGPSPSSSSSPSLVPPSPLPRSPSRAAQPLRPAAPPCRAALPIPLPLCGRPALLHPLPGARRQGEAGKAVVRRHGERQGRPDEQGVGRTGRARQEGPDQPKMLPEATLLELGA